MSVLTAPVTFQTAIQSKPTLCVGVPFYGPQEAAWWVQFAQHMSELHHTVDLMEIISMGSMATDHNRNAIVHDFLEKGAEWLLWIDADTIVPMGSVARLLAVGKTMVSGLYYGKNPPHPPIAYHLYNGAVRPIDQTRRWEKGEILPVDACGMGCMLTHRSVYEDIMNTHEVYQRVGGSLVVIPKKNIIGDIREGDWHEHDEKVYRGQYRQRLRKPTLINMKFPFFALEHGRTEDLWFFDLARQAGHRAWLDTSVECLHLRAQPFTGAEYRDLNGH